MARGDQLARQWRIIQTLISARHGKSVSNLAQDLSCHTRTVYRDLEALQAAGVRDNVKVMVGGAPVTEKYAQEITADSYASDAATAVVAAKKLLGIA